MTDHDLRRLEAKLDYMIALISRLVPEVILMSAELDRLTQSVTAEGDVVTAVEQALAGLTQQIKDLAANGGSPAQFTALADQIDQYRARLAAAVAAGTPVAPGGAQAARGQGGHPTPGGHPGTTTAPKKP
jgi:hypothetical protein